MLVRLEEGLVCGLIALMVALVMNRVVALEVGGAGLVDKRSRLRLSLGLGIEGLILFLRSNCINPSESRCATQMIKSPHT